jgi:bifunctional non-homologous end joining protein LigD
MRLEGIICMRADAPHRAGRGAAWLREEFVVIGWLPLGGRLKDIGSLAIGFYDVDGRLHYAGSVGTVFQIRSCWTCMLR